LQIGMLKEEQAPLLAGRSSLGGGYVNPLLFKIVSTKKD